MVVGCSFGANRVMVMVREVTQLDRAPAGGWGMASIVACVRKNGTERMQQGSILWRRG